MMEWRINEASATKELLDEPVDRQWYREASKRAELDTELKWKDGEWAIVRRKKKSGLFQPSLLQRH